MQATGKIMPKHGFKLIFLECAFVYGKSVQPLIDCTQTKIRLSSSRCHSRKERI